jgi:hypothetical protein
LGFRRCRKTKATSATAVISRRSVTSVPSFVAAGALLVATGLAILPRQGTFSDVRTGRS